MRHTHRILGIAFGWLLASSASAQTRVAVDDFYGPYGRSLRQEVANVLGRQDGLVVVSKAEVHAAANRLGVDSFSPEGRKELSRELLLSAWLTGVVHARRSGSARLTIVVYDGAAHADMGRMEFSARSTRKLRSTIREELWSKSRDAVMHALAPLPPGRAPIHTQEAAGKCSPEERAVVTVSSTPRVAAAFHDGSEDGARRARQRRDALHAIVGFGSPYRSLAYSDPVSESLGDYQLAGAPMLDLSLSYYPGRHFGDGWFSHLGLDAAAQTAFGVASSDRQGNEYEASYGAYRVGLRGTLPLGAHAISLFSGYAAQRFRISARDAQIEAPTPDVDYRAVRSGAGGRLALGDALSLGLDAAWLHVLSVGEIGSWFPRATAGGLELALHATFALTRHVFARLSGTYQRTFFDFHAQRGDERVAGGATDQFLTMAVGAGVSL